MAKPIPQFDYENNLEPDMLRFLVRVEELERKAREEARLIHMKDLEWDTHVSEIKRELRLFKSQLMDIKSRIERFKNNFISNVSDFRLKANMDEFRRLESKIDNMNFENLITKSEFLRKRSLE